MIGLLPLALMPGDLVAPFEPYWVNGEYKDTNMCPVCEYGVQPMVQVWTKGENATELSAIVKLVDKETAQDASSVRGFLIDANLSGDDAASKSRLGFWETRWNAKNVVFLTRRTELSEVLKNYKLDEKGWTNVVYVIKDRTVKSTFVDPRGEKLDELRKAIRAVK